MNLLCFFTTIVLFTVLVSKAKKYKVKLISIEKCKNIESKVDESEPVTYETSAKKINKHVSVVRTNFTILRTIGPVLINFRIYQLKNASSKDVIFKMEKVDCHNPFLYQMIRVGHLKMDNNCMAAPGHYITDYINLQDFTWILSKLMVTPGKHVYIELEFYTEAKGIAVCNTIVTDILELK